ncbi:3-hydroxyacyl-CoA dehydrogenase [Cynara cardunculus var. scolymus]|uniref:3-hydroxyacyl-CoA dehydrogenase n=1 Tax=Cynara cardunculus var. scolymus TaxID=59895 RepID=A0A103XLP4_CYNCS|nr:3-hydroxyacyl-CoA dehydrogenase [Cynara cardunculus var. scolymus]
MTDYMAESKVIGVVGAGQMGAGIAQLAAVSGADVWLLDKDAGALLTAKSSISDSVQRFVSKGQLSKEGGINALSHLQYTSNLEDLRFADIVIEAIVESEDVKKKLFVELDKMVIGMHFMNPPPIMKLVEDYAGFIVNRILMPMINEAFHALYTGVATKEDIDAGMKLGTNQPMGPLQLADFIGLDVCLSILKVLQNGLGDIKYAPCPLLVQYVDAGRLGRKRGIGVYNYRKLPKELKPSPRL